jgi:hypothetical protein
MDLSVDLIAATVQIEQARSDGTRTVGTGFLINQPQLDGRPRTVLVTAAHVLERMPNTQARIGYRIQSEGSWKYDPQPLDIRNEAGSPLWSRHPDRDVAVITVIVPPAFAKAAIPLAWLASDDTFDKARLAPGEELLALGFPEGLSANPAGFPILRAGRLASYPVTPIKDYPTFLMDFSVFPGNSGGPVFLELASPARSRIKGKAPGGAFVAGILTQEVEVKGEHLGIGVVTHARFVREAVEALDHPLAVSPQSPVEDGALTVDASGSASDQNTIP